MLEFFWGCLIGGAIFSIFQLLAGDLFHHGIDGAGHEVAGHHLDWLHPTTIVGGITAFGGAGVILLRYTDLEAWPAVVMAVAIATVISAALHFLYVRPMRNSENSIGFSMNEYVGMIGEVTIPIPGKGCGEVMVRMGAANTCQIATSFNSEWISTGRRVVVIEAHSDLLVVSPYEEVE
jgi:membrane-bound ClpP family serine protease